jgi:excisionase family DNA binding protein
MTRAPRSRIDKISGGERLLKPREAAPLLGVSNRTVLAWLLGGKLDGTQTPGGQWRVPYSAVRAMAAELGHTWPTRDGATP